MSENTKQFLWIILVIITLPILPVIVFILFILWIIPAFFGWIFGDIIKSNGGITT